jgi:hypothetical protein
VLGDNHIVFDLFSPYVAVSDSNPVFQRDQKQLRWLKTPQSLRKFNRRVWLGIPAAAFCWWFLERANIGFRYTQPSYEWNLVLISLYLSLGWMLLSSLWMMVVTIGQFHRHFHCIEWQILKITHQPDVDILAAKDSAAQIHVWILTAIESSIKITTPCLLILNFLYSSYQGSADKAIFIGTFFFNIFCWVFYALMLGIGVAYALEPIFRMRLIVALSALIAFRIQNITFALLTGFVTILLIHLTQIAVISGLGYLLVASAQGDDYVFFVLLFLFIPFCFIVFCLYLMLYVRIRNKITTLTLIQVSATN